METRAPYALIGLFVLAAIGAVFGFVYWLHNTGGLGERTLYRVRFENNVAGLLTGAAVLFNGIRVGEVVDLQLNPDNPREVTAAISVVAGTPVRADTRAGLEFQGLTGVPLISLLGGDAGAAPLTSSKTEPAILIADPTAGQSMTEAARQALRKLDALLADNSDSLHSAIANLNTFTGALARNSDRVDSILTSLEHMAGGGAPKAAPVIYDLTAPRVFPPPKQAPKGQLVVAEPTALVALTARGSSSIPVPGKRQRMPNGVTPFRRYSRKRSSRASRRRTTSVPLRGRWKVLRRTISFCSIFAASGSWDRRRRPRLASSSRRRLSATAVGSSDRGHSKRWSRPRT